MYFRGDFNLVAHPKLDRNTGIHTSEAATLQSFQLGNAWRSHNTGTRAYTFYSHPHNSFAILDYIFCTPIILANSTNSDILVCPWSDHNIVTLTTTLIGLSDTPYAWRLNDSLLADPITRQEISTAIQEFFTLNATPDRSPSTLWVAHKAVLRGQLISIASRKNRERWQQIYTLTTELDKSYKIQTRNPTLSNTQLLAQKCLELDTILSS